MYKETVLNKMGKLEKMAEWKRSVKLAEKARCKEFARLKAIRLEEEAKDKKIDRMLDQTVIFVIIIMVIGVYKLLS